MTLKRIIKKTVLFLADALFWQYLEELRKSVENFSQGIQ
jgi:hypothetical protein